MNTAEKRKELIGQLEEQRSSRVLVLFIGDRFPMVPSPFSGELQRPFFDQLGGMEFEKKRKTVDLFLYGHGGHAGTAWALVNMIRGVCDAFNVLVPYRCRDAATLLALGADSIEMGSLGELSPIDPRLGTTGQPQSADQPDGSGYGGKKDQLRRLVRKLLGTRKEKISEERIETILAFLAGDLYPFDHRVNRLEAKDIGLHIATPRQETEGLLWSLYREYEEFLQLKSSPQPEMELGEAETKQIRDLPLAVLESREKVHVYKADLHLRKERRIPQAPQINLELSLKTPTDMDVSRLQDETKTLLRHLRQKLAQIIHREVEKEIVRQSPVVGVEIRALGGNWVPED